MLRCEYAVISDIGEVGNNQLCVRTFNIYVILWGWNKVSTFVVTITWMRSSELYAKWRRQSLKQFTNKPIAKREKMYVIMSTNSNGDKVRSQLFARAKSSCMIHNHFHHCQNSDQTPSAEYPYVHDTTSTYAYGPSLHDVWCTLAPIFSPFDL